MENADEFRLLAEADAGQSLEGYQAMEGLPVATAEASIRGSGHEHMHPALQENVPPPIDDLQPQQPPVPYAAYAPSPFDCLRSFTCYTGFKNVFAHFKGGLISSIEWQQPLAHAKPAIRSLRCNVTWTCSATLLASSRRTHVTRSLHGAP